jgi:death-on-curing protein
MKYWKRMSISYGSLAGSQAFYATIVEKAATLGFSLIQNHPFVDGNKRTAHAAMETFLVLNGYQLNATVEEQEDTILKVAAGQSGREAFTEWLRQHVQAMP